MSIIFKLTDEDFNIKPNKDVKYDLRLSSRGIIIREDGKIAVQYKENKNVYKLIGGGLENNEDPIQTFKREVLEETGCEIEIIDELGTIEEYRSLNNLKQVSHIFVAKVINDTYKLNLTEFEKSDNAKLLWVNPNDALMLITDCYKKLLLNYDDEYNNKFIILRDIKILECYLKKNTDFKNDDVCM